LAYKKILLIFGLLALSNCVRTGVMPLSANTIQISVSAAPACGAAGAQQIAAKDAAVATLQNGFDGFIILSGEAQNNVHVVGFTPVQSQTYSTATAYGSSGMATAYGSSSTTYSGGQPIIGGSHDQLIIVQMFHSGDPGAENALSARALLGPNWQQIVAKGFPRNCF